MSTMQTMRPALSFSGGVLHVLDEHFELCAVPEVAQVEVRMKVVAVLDVLAISRLMAGALLHLEHASGGLDDDDLRTHSGTKFHGYSVVGRFFILNIIQILSNDALTKG